MAGCCNSRGCDQFFGPRFARRTAERYRKRGLDKTAQQMVAFLEQRGLAGATVLEVGGGVGAIQIEHGQQMMALAGQYEKAGKACRPAVGAAFSFSRLCDVAFISYADLPMRNPTKVTVIWETVPDPDPHALLKAVAMMFNRQVPLSTDVDLTERNGTLHFRRLPKS